MKKTKRLICLVLVTFLLFCNIPFSAAEQEPTVMAGNATVNAGEKGRIAVSVDEFENFIGGFNFEIKFPDKIQITAVYLNGEKLTSLADGGSDYNIRTGNRLCLAGVCNYGGSNGLNDDSVYYIDFLASENIGAGNYDVEFTDSTYIVSDFDDEELIFPVTVDGKITVGGLKADIDGSQSADATDVVIFKRWLIGGNYGEVFNDAAADVNEDGVLDIRDLVALKKYFARVVVYLSDNGDDNNEGDSAENSVATLNRAIEQVYEGGTVYITDTYTPDSQFNWKKHLKSVEISGGVLDATALSVFDIRDNTTFDDITLKFGNGADVYANGCELRICENVTVNGKPYLYGGGRAEVGTTSLKIYAGSYQYVCGGGKNADVVGDTNVVIGGNVNSEIDETNHGGGIYLVGGSNNGVVGGNTNITVGGNAKATYIIGAGIGANSDVSGKTQVAIEGGAFMSAYAGSTNGKCSNTELTISGGTIEQIFGGNESASMTGNTYLKILGGTVTRRIYGGCYNNFDEKSFKWTSQYHVIGNTTVYLSSKATVKFGSFRDYGIFACSRYKSHFDDENSTIIFEDSTAQNEFKGSLGQQDLLSKFITSWPQASKTSTILG